MALYIHVPFFDGKHSKVLLSLQISPLRLEVLHLVPVVLSKTHICCCSVDGEGEEWEGVGQGGGGMGWGGPGRRGVGEGIYYISSHY